MRSVGVVRWIVRTSAWIFGLAVTLSLIATLLFASSRHPECASIPGDVGSCEFWGRVGDYGPFIMIYGTVVSAGIIASIWLPVAIVRTLIIGLRTRRRSQQPVARE